MDLGTMWCTWHAAGGVSQPGNAHCRSLMVTALRRCAGIVSVAVPIQYMMATRGALQLSTQGGDIDHVIASERWAILRFFGVLAAIRYLES